MEEKLLQWTYQRLINEHPHALDFFSALDLTPDSAQQTIDDLFSHSDPKQLDALGFDHNQLPRRFLAFMDQMDQLRQKQSGRIGSITIIGGCDKSGSPEDINLTLNAGEIICVVGPTGAGKSMLLADIECAAQGDTPSGRRILIDGKVLDDQQRLSGEHHLVAQLSQNMNFVMDLSVEEFLKLHAESRLVKELDAVVANVFKTAVQLAGEPFSLETPVTSLSGGQSRALMIADVACISTSPIVLIDEIENAGVDRLKALDLLTAQSKIVIMATHDPLLALSGHRRLVIQNGGIASVLDTTEEEKTVLKELDTMDRRLTELRFKIRSGQRL